MFEDASEASGCGGVLLNANLLFFHAAAAMLYTTDRVPRANAYSGNPLPALQA